MLFRSVRGNYSECAALLSEKAIGKGIDSVNEAGEGLKLAKEASAKYKCIFAVTGATDYISNGKQALMIGGGHPLLAEITGAGCMTSVLCACAMAVTKDFLAATALGVVIMGQAAEISANFLEKKDGPSMFKIRLLDGIYHISTKWDLLKLQQERKLTDEN